MSCATEQLRHLRDLGGHALWARRLPGELTVLLDGETDEATVGAALTAERACCPFVGLVWDPERNELTVVTRPDHEPVLERVADALGVPALL